MRNLARRVIDTTEAQTCFQLDQAAAEGAALHGEFGHERQIRALSAHYAELRAAGELLKARAIKYQAIVIRAVHPA